MPFEKSFGSFCVHTDAKGTHPDCGKNHADRICAKYDYLQSKNIGHGKMNARSAKDLGSSINERQSIYLSKIVNRTNTCTCFVIHLFMNVQSDLTAVIVNSAQVFFFFLTPYRRCVDRPRKTRLSVFGVSSCV